MDLKPKVISIFSIFLPLRSPSQAYPAALRSPPSPGLPSPPKPLLLPSLTLALQRRSWAPARPRWPPQGRPCPSPRPSPRPSPPRPRHPRPPHAHPRARPRSHNSRLTFRWLTWLSHPPLPHPQAPPTACPPTPRVWGTQGPPALPRPVHPHPTHTGAPQYPQGCPRAYPRACLHLLCPQG